MTGPARLGWIGLGKMGQPMALGLLKAGAPLTVYNRNRERLKPLLAAGAREADSPRAVGMASDLVFTMVADDQALQEVALEALGPPVDPQALVRIDMPEPEIGQNRLRATVLYVDRFGNMQLNLTREHLEQADVQPGVTVELELALERYYAIAARTFADARPGDIILYEDAYRNLSIAINGGNAAELFGAAAGQEVRIHLRTP